MTGRRAAAWAAGVTAAAGLLWGGYRVSIRLAEAGPEIAGNRALLAALTLAIVVLALGLAGVLIRNLVRLIADRKQGILGAKLRTKIVFFFLALVLLPAFLLSYGAAAFIKGTVEQLLRTPIEDLSQQAREVVREEARREEASVLRVAETLAQWTARGGGPASSRPDLGQYRSQLGVDLAGVLSLRGGTAPFVASLDDALERASGPAVRAAAEALARTAAASGRTLVRRAELPEGPLLQAAAPAPDGAVVVVRRLSGAQASRLVVIDAADQAYRQFRAERRELLRLYYSVITLVGLSTVFVASWIGFYVSRRIAGPIQELSAAARQISAGNLDVRVRAGAGDEVGMLVDAFNDMAAQLEESRGVIVRSAADLRRINQALDERRRYIETLIENLTPAVVSLDREGRVTTANRSVRPILGIDAPVGEPLLPALERQGLAPLKAMLEDLAASGGADERRDLVLSRGGEPLFVAAQAAVLRGAKGEELGTLLVVEDLTDLLRAQRAATWQEVARRIAHEIKNPLTPIQLVAQRLRKKAQEGTHDLPAVIEESATAIEHEVAGLKRLVDAFSRYARMPEPQPELVDLRSVVDSVLRLYAAHTGVRWEVAVDPALPHVRVDAEQMRRVLINLVDNALTAMDGKGTVTIEAGRDDATGSVRIAVADDGPGIPVSDREKLFLPYYSTKRRGSGLGLAIVQRIVVEHRGSIRVDDAPSGGARFVIEIPQDPVPAGEESERWRPRTS